MQTQISEKWFKQYSPYLCVTLGWDKHYGWYVGAYRNKRNGIVNEARRFYSSEKSARNAYRKVNTYWKANNRI